MTMQGFAHRADRLIRSFIGWSLPPAEWAIDEAGWAPDDPRAYCGRCGSGVGPGEIDAKGCGDCRSHRPAFDRVVRLGSYSDPLREWVLSMKYRRWTEMAESLGNRLGDALVQRAAIEPGRAIVVPMPMPWQRRLYRGIDHAVLLADAVARALTGRELRTNRAARAPVIRLLTKRNGPPQVGLPATQRKTNLRDRMSVRREFRRDDLAGWDVVLVDDVRTTGASLQAASKVIRTLGPRRVVAAVAAVADGARRGHAATGAVAMACATR
jgi:predicted amidophosphoribosyltransferase